MSFLLTPLRRNGESAQGYLHRLASENALPFRTAAMVARDVVTAPLDLPTGTNDAKPILRRGSGRFCPGCLAEECHWRNAWEIPFVDACPIHGNWLIDICSACGNHPNWTRPSLLVCSCGAVFATQAASAAPDCVANLASDLIGLAEGRPARRLAPLTGLSLEQAVRLVRFVGAYGVSPGRLPQKAPRLDRMSSSWPISAYASEVLSAWPDGFTNLLEVMRKKVPDDQQGSLPRVFRGMYTAIYRGLKDPEFDFVRSAFEQFVAERWTGSLSRRNRRLQPSTHENAAWVSAKEAAITLHVSPAQIRKLAEAGEIVAERRTTPGGRLIVTVRRDSLARGVPRRAACSLGDAARRLGMKRSRLARVFGPLSPLRQERNPAGNIWQIDETLIARLQAAVAHAPLLDRPRPGLFTLNDVLRYWALPDACIATLLHELAEGRVDPAGRLAGLEGLPSLLLSLGHLKSLQLGWRERVDAGRSAPETALLLQVKQEVVYFLIRNGFLGATIVRGPRRVEWRVSEAQVDTFRETYSFARDLAAAHGVSPRKMIAQLAAGGCRPCSGSRVDGGRQTLYRCADLAGMNVMPAGGREWDC